MLEQWETHECWVAHFDILGFKSLLEKGSMEFEPVLSQSKIDDILNQSLLQNCAFEPSRLAEAVT